MPNNRSQPTINVPTTGSIRLIHNSDVIVQTLVGRVKAKVPDGFPWQLKVGDQVLIFGDHQQSWVLQLLRQPINQTLTMKTNGKLKIQADELEISARKCTSHFDNRYEKVDSTQYLEANNRIEKVHSIASTKARVDIKQAEEVAVNAGKILFNC